MDGRFRWRPTSSVMASFRSSSIPPSFAIESPSRASRGVEVPVSRRPRSSSRSGAHARGRSSSRTAPRRAAVGQGQGAARVRSAPRHRRRCPRGSCGRREERRRRNDRRRSRSSDACPRGTPERRSHQGADRGRPGPVRRRRGDRARPVPERRPCTADGHAAAPVRAWCRRRPDGRPQRRDARAPRPHRALRRDVVPRRGDS